MKRSMMISADKNLNYENIVANLIYGALFLLKFKTKTKTFTHTHIILNTIVVFLNHLLL